MQITKISAYNNTSFRAKQRNYKEEYTYAQAYSAALRQNEKLVIDIEGKKTKLIKAHDDAFNLHSCGRHEEALSVKRDMEKLLEQSIKDIKIEIKNIESNESEIDRAIRKNDLLKEYLRSSYRELRHYMTLDKL